MTRRDRLRGLRFQPGPQLAAEVRRSCRNELKIIYEAASFPRSAWEALARLGQAQVLEASKINPAMKDLYRVTCPAMRLEGAVGGTTLLAFFRGKGRLGARHALERALNEALR